MIAARRQRLGLTYEELSQASGVPTATIYHGFTGERHLTVENFEALDATLLRDERKASAGARGAA